MMNIIFDGNNNIEKEIRKNSKIEEKIRIYSFNEFENNKLKSEQIIVIDIKTYNFQDLIELSMLKLINLEELILSNNNISDIKPLTFTKLPNLKKLNLEMN